MIPFSFDNPPHLELATQETSHNSEYIRKLVINQPNHVQTSVATGILFLWHDLWQEAHEIAQSHEGEADHDLLHAIVHRREGDYSNAIYWLRSAGQHGCYPLIAARQSKNLAGHPLLGTLLADGIWNPVAFATAVRTRKPADDRLLRQIQAVELMTFYEWMRNKA